MNEEYECEDGACAIDYTRDTPKSKNLFL